MTFYSARFSHRTLIAMLLGLAATAWAADSAKRSFAIPGGNAETTLRQFSQQAGVQFIFDTELVSGLRTAAVKGEYFPREALDRMFTGTGWTAVQDPKTGALALRKGTSEKNVPRAANTAPVASVATVTLQGRVINAAGGASLENVRISIPGTTLETYTNQDGEYRLADVPAGNVRVTADHTGFAVRVDELTLEAGAQVHRDFELRLVGSESWKTNDDVLVLDTFTVRDRELTGQAMAQQERRYAPNIKNVVSLTEFSDMGEGNVGEVLKYVPGVAMDYNPQSAQYPYIRGMPASGTLVTTDGIQAASANAAGGRSYDMSLAASGNIDRVEVTKVPTPDIPANAVGGKINLITKSGFSRKTPLLTYNVFSTYTSLDGLSGPGKVFTKSSGPDGQSNIHRVNPAFNISYLLPVNKSLGLTFSLSKSERYNDFQYLDPRWDKIGLRLSTTVLRTLPFIENKFLGSGTADWKISKRHSVRVAFQHSDQDVYLRQYQNVDTFAAGATGDATFVKGAPTGVGQVSQANTWYNLNRTLDHLPISYKFDGANWKVDANFAYSSASATFEDTKAGFFRATNSRILNLIVENRNLSGFPDRRIPLVTATTRTGQLVDVWNANNYSVTTVSTMPQDDRTVQGRSGAFNVTRDFHFSFPFSIKMGAAVDRQRNTYDGELQTYTFAPPGGTAATLVGNYDLIANTYSGVNHFTDVKGESTAASFLDHRKLFSLYQQHPDWFTLNAPAAHISRVNLTKTIDETISAAYFRNDLRFFKNRLWIVSGVRFEKTQDKGWGPLNDLRRTLQQDANGNLLRDSAGRTIPVTTDALAVAKLRYVARGTYTDKSYQGFYPSVNVSYSLTEKIVLRGAYAATIGRPDFPDIIPGVTITSPDSTSANRIITAVNSGLKPWTANNYDLSLEAYAVKGGTASISLFRKDIKNFFAGTRSAATIESLTELGLTEDYLDYDIVTKKNGGAATLQGVELEYRQSFNSHRWAKGLEVFGNLTIMDLSGPNADDFTRFTPRTASWGISYSRPKFNVKMNVTNIGMRRIEPVAPTAVIAANSYRYYLPWTRIDLSAEYMFTKQIGIYGSVRNLFGAPLLQGTWAADTPDYARVDLYQFTGAVFTLGLKGSF